MWCIPVVMLRNQSSSQATGVSVLCVLFKECWIIGHHLWAATVGDSRNGLCISQTSGHSCYTLSLPTHGQDDRVLRTSND